MNTPYLGFRWKGVFGGSFEVNGSGFFTGEESVNTLFYNLSGCAFIAALVRTALASSKLRLYKSSFTPTSASPLADYVTNEADYTGYAAGGITLTTWNAPILDPVSGYRIQAPMSQFITSNPTTVGNVIGGWFLVETGGALIATGTFGTPQAMQVPSAGIDLAPVLTFPTGG